MAVESVALGSQVQASLQALKSALESEAAVVSLVEQAAASGGGSQLASPATTSTDSSRLLDIVV